MGVVSQSLLCSRSCGSVAVTLGSRRGHFLSVGMVRGWMLSLANTGSPSAPTVKVRGQGNGNGSSKAGVSFWGITSRHLCTETQPLIQCNMWLESNHCSFDLYSSLWGSWRQCIWQLAAHITHNGILPFYSTGIYCYHFNGLILVPVHCKWCPALYTAVAFSYVWTVQMTPIIRCSG